MKNRIRICNWIAYFLFVSLVFVTLPFLIVKPFGIEPYGILSNSMEPDYPVGSIVYVKKVSPQDIQINDVITFQLGTANENVATHRVIMIDLDQQEFYTKGDNNKDMDAFPVVYSRLIGKVILCIPMLGHFYMALVSIYGMTCCVFMFLMMIILWMLVYKWKSELRNH